MNGRMERPQDKQTVMVMLHVTLNIIHRVEPKQNGHYLSFHSENVKTDHFKPPPSSDVTKIKYSSRFHSVFWHSKDQFSRGHG